VTIVGSSIRSHEYIATGGVTVGNLLHPTEFTVSYSCALPMTWNVFGNLSNSLECNWDIYGSTVLLYWWRVESEMIQSLDDVYIDTGEEPSSGSCFVKSCGTSYVQYLTAKSLEDLCIKLKETLLVRPLLCWRIKSIKKYLKPVYYTDDVAAGQDTTAWITLEEQSTWTIVPECMEFHLDAGQCSGQIIIPGTTTGSSKIFNNTPGSIGITTTDDVIIKAVAPNVSAGFFTQYYHINLYEASGGITISGIATACFLGSFGLDFNSAFNVDRCAATEIALYNLINTYVYKSSGKVMAYGNTKVTKYSNNYDDVTDGKVNVAGKALICPGFYVAKYSNIVIGGSAKVTRSAWNYISSGFISIISSYRVTFKYKATGGVLIKGSSLPGLMATGGVNISGVAPIMMSHASVVASGGVTIGGIALLNSSWLGTLYVDMGSQNVYEDLPNLDANLYVMNVLNWTQSNQKVVVDCSCPSIAQSLYMSHDFNKLAKPKYFLLRNKLILPDSIILSYNGKNWSGSNHFSGIGEVDGSTEQWILQYTLTCANSIANINIGDYNWQYVLFVSRTQFFIDGTKKRSTSKLRVNITVSSTCQLELTFGFLYEEDGTAVDSITGNSVSSVDLIDNIGLFDAKTWYTNTNLKVEISEQEIKRATYVTFG
jgi:hypothetical protein